jgi:hypothetical protein
MNLPREIEDALGEAIADANAKIRIGYPWWLRPFLLRDVAAITLGHRVYLGAQVRPDSVARLLRHELAHVRQVQRLGLLRFYWRYLYEFGRHFSRVRSLDKAYNLISFEREAVEAERGATYNQPTVEP